MRKSTRGSIEVVFLYMRNVAYVRKRMAVQDLPKVGSNIKLRGRMVRVEYVERHPGLASVYTETLVLCGCCKGPTEYTGTCNRGCCGRYWCGNRQCGAMTHGHIPFSELERSRVVFPEPGNQPPQSVDSK